MLKTWDAAGRLLAGFAGASLAAVAIGAAVCAISGDVPPGLWTRNLAAWLVGAVAALGIAAAFRPIVLPVVLWAAPAGLLAAFMSAPQQGVHRWIDAGPLHINAAMLLLPAAVVALAALATARRKAWVAALTALALLAAQPDASQATALAGAVILTTLLATRSLPLRLGLIAVAVALAGVAWTRPDPLQPVAEVEGIIGLAWSVSPVTAVLSVAALAAVVVVPAIVVRAPGAPGRTAGLALSLCLGLWAATPLLGAFPVPLAGMGLSPILGAWLGVGLLAGLMRRGA